MPKRKSTYSAHSKLIDDLMLAFGSTPYVRIFPKVVGTFRMLFAERKVHVGNKGEPDLWGIVYPFGLYFVIEAKTGTGRLSKDQKKWRDFLESMGCIHIEARSVEQAKKEFNLKVWHWMECAQNRLNEGWKDRVWKDI